MLGMPMTRRAPPLPTINLQTPIAAVDGVGPEKGVAFEALGIRSVGHLIYYLPARHEQHQAEAPIRDVVAGSVVSLRGEVTATRVMPHGRRPRFEAIVQDETGQAQLIWFNQMYLVQRIHPGMRLRLTGRSQRRSGRLVLTNPRHEVIDPQRAEPQLKDARIRPVYPASEKLPSWMIERAVGRVLDAALPLIEDHLPEKFRVERALPRLAEAYRMVHRPENMAEVSAAVRRLTYDELLLLQLGVFMKRAHVRHALRAPALRWTKAIDEHIRARLPFRLTPGQEGAIGEIVADLQKPQPANRLIQGDVGSGKTVVALYAMLTAVAGRHQAALMAPTELLAEQHMGTIEEMLRGSNVRLALLTGSLDAASRAALLERISRGEIDLVVGTHALLTEGVSFNSLAVAVIDEQHRFGVHQRATLREKSSDAASAPHTLVMTATPIPRTLSLTVFGDLDVSTLKGMPAGRGAITTNLVEPGERASAYAQVRTRLERGEQGYVVVPTIGEDEGPRIGETKADADQSEPAGASLRSLFAELEAGPLKGLRLAAVHGRLNREAREATMERFRAGQIDLLVATPIIEVGVDVPNASVMVIERADRFGLAQLHQLRGRIGRGSRESLCFLSPSENPGPTPEGVERLRILTSTTDGFAIAEKDLEQRGPGELLGHRQAGTAPFRLAEFPRDTELLMMARRDAAAWIDRSPALASPEEALLKSRLMKAHGESLGLADVA